MGTRSKGAEGYQVAVTGNRPIPNRRLKRKLVPASKEPLYHSIIIRQKSLSALVLSSFPEEFNKALEGDQASGLLTAQFIEIGAIRTS